MPNHCIVSYTLPSIIAEIVEILSADDTLRDYRVAILGDPSGDIAAEVEKAMASTGTCVIVMLGEFRGESQEPAILGGTATIHLQCIETPALYRTGTYLPALVIAEHIALLASSWGGAKCTGLRLLDLGTRETLAYQVSVDVATAFYRSPPPTPPEQE